MPTSMREWLEQLGLSEYLAQFESAQVGLDSLPHLTDSHLKEIGIPVGPRIRMLAAIGGSPQDAGEAEMPERRHMTVMFADLVGSTKLSTQLDPEDLRELIRSFHNTIDRQVARFDASVAQYLGDGAMVYFGYPIAHEDSAERAVAAALAIVEAVAALRSPAGAALSAHVGIATGVTVVGGSTRRSRVKNWSAIGEAPNLAARLVDLAGSGEIVISEQTYRLVRHQFSARSLGMRALKGLPRPVTPYQVLSELAVETRFEARHAMAVPVMVGRDRELANLLDRWQMASMGQGQVVLLTGEAGIGKSRLVRALEQSIEGVPHERITHQCSPHHVGSALYPSTRQIARSAGLAQEDDHAAQWRKLNAHLVEADPVDAALIAGLFGLDSHCTGLALDLTPAEARRRTFQSLMQQLESMARRGPVFWLLEDAHWIDPTSLELLDLCVQRVAALPVLIVVTFRPEFVHAFPAAAHVGALPLSRLLPEEVASLVRNLCAGRDVPMDALQQISSRTDGVPLFVEELTKSLLDVGGLVDRDGVIELADGNRLLSVPASLHDSLMARLDRHRSQKDVAQIASCIGREFDYALLSRVAGMPQHELDAALAQLRDAELVFDVRVDNRTQYAFKHALVRDAAYESLLKSRRETLHAGVLSALRATADTPIELLATHASAAGLRAQAIELWSRAAAQAMARNGFGEAIAHLKLALELNGSDPSAGRDMLVQRLDLLLALGQATMPLRGYSHSETVRVFSQAHVLAQQLSDGMRAFWVAYARWVVYYVRGEHGKAQSIAQDMLGQSRDERNAGQELTALRALGISQMIGGDPRSADVTFTSAELLADQVRQQPPERRIAVARRFAADPEIATQFHVALTSWSLGRIAEARVLSERAVHDARQMRHVHTLGHALTHGAIVAVVDRDAARAVELCEEAVSLSQKHGMELWVGYGHMLHGYALSLGGGFDRGASLLQSGLAQLARTETGTMVPMHHAVCAWALTRLHRMDEAEKHEQAVHSELSTGVERYFWVDMLIWLGRRHQVTDLNGSGRTEQYYRRALDEARRQGALSWQLRAATALAGLWLSRGNRTRATELVEPLLATMRPLQTSRLWRAACSVVEGVVPDPDA